MIQKYPLEYFSREWRMPWILQRHQEHHILSHRSSLELSTSSKKQIYTKKEYENGEGRPKLIKHRPISRNISQKRQKISRKIAK